MILTFRNPHKVHKGIFILFSQHFYVSTYIKLERIKRWKQAKENSLPGHFHKNTHNIKNKIARRNPSRRWAKSLREIQDITEWRDMLCQWFGKLNIVNVNHPQISLSPLKFLNLISVKIPLSFSFGENDKLISKFIQNTSNREWPSQLVRKATKSEELI